MIRLDIDYSKYSKWHHHTTRHPGQLTGLGIDTLFAYRQLAEAFYILKWDSSKQVSIDTIKDNTEHIDDTIHKIAQTARSINRLAFYDESVLQHQLYQVGQRTPILLCDNLLIDGHRRLEAAKQLGWNTIAAIQIPPETESATLIGMRYILNHTDRKAVSD